MTYGISSYRESPPYDHHDEPDPPVDPALAPADPAMDELPPTIKNAPDNVKKAYDDAVKADNGAHKQNLEKLVESEAFKNLNDADKAEILSAHKDSPAARNAIVKALGDDGKLKGVLKLINCDGFGKLTEPQRAQLLNKYLTDDGFRKAIDRIVVNEEPGKNNMMFSELPAHEQAHALDILYRYSNRRDDSFGWQIDGRGSKGKNQEEVLVRLWKSELSDKSFYGNDDSQFNKADVPEQETKAQRERIDTFAHGKKLSNIQEPPHDPKTEKHSAAADQFEAAAREPGISPQDIKRRWDSLSAEEQNYLIHHKPEIVGPLDGVPSAKRHEANMTLLRRQKEELEIEFRQPSRDANKIQTLRQKLEGIKAIEDRVAQGGLLLKLDAAPGRGRAIVATSDPDNAKNIVTLVPGAGAGLENVKDHIERADNIVEAAKKIDPGSTVGIAWVDYDTPPTKDELGHQTAWDTSYAENAQDDLAKFQEGLRATHQGEPSRNTLVGHSYGATVIGFADRADQGKTLDADEIIFLGSPGAGVNHVSGLMHRNHIWSTTASDDPIKHFNKVNLLGENPSDASFGARLFHSDAGADDPHSDYLKKGAASLTNLGRIVTGKYDRAEEDMRAMANGTDKTPKDANGNPRKGDLNLTGVTLEKGDYVFVRNDEGKVTAALVFGNDGNLHSYALNGDGTWRETWTSNAKAGGTKVEFGGVNGAGARIIDDKGGEHWSTHPGYRSDLSTVMQADGNFVVYEIHPGRDRTVLGAGGTGYSIGYQNGVNGHKSWPDGHTHN